MTEHSATARFMASEVFLATMDELHVLNKVAIFLEGGPTLMTFIRFFGGGGAGNLVFIVYPCTREGALASGTITRIGFGDRTRTR